MENDRRLNHYIERIYFYTSRAAEREVCKSVLDTLADVYPKVFLVYLNSQFLIFFLLLKLIGNIKEHSIDKNYPTEFVDKKEKQIENQNKSIIPDPHINFYEGKVGPYDLRLKVKF